MANLIQQRRDTLTNWNLKNPILAEGEIGFETSSIPYKMKIGNGVDKWSVLPYTLDVNSNVVSGPYRSVIVALGDSITAGYPYTDNSPIDSIDLSSWTNTVRTRLGVTIHNKGIGGQTSTEILARFDVDVLLNKPTHCIIMWGINDAWKPEKGVTFAQTQQNTIDIIKKCKDNNIIPIFGLFTPLELTGEALKIQKCNEIRTWIFNYCQSNKIDVIDFYSYFLENITSLPINEYYYTDLLHPNDIGYPVMGDTACQFLKNILPEFKGTRSPLENYLRFNKSGTAPKIVYNTGDLVVEKKPTLGLPLFWTCIDGLANKWASSGVIRDIRCLPLSKVFFINSYDATDYYWQKDDLVFSIDSATAITVYRVDLSGYSKVHSVVSERATFTALTVLNTGVSSGPMAYEDFYSNPNTTQFYKAGDTVRFVAQNEVYYVMTAGYGASSPNSPKATFKSI